VVRLGFTSNVVIDLVLRRLWAEAVIANPDLNLAQLRDQVTSPGGTTEGLLALKDGALTAVFHRALKAASDKGQKLT
jgi:pyrroline-5-carboxylate reductase